MCYNQQIAFNALFFSSPISIQEQSGEPPTDQHHRRRIRNGIEGQGTTGNGASAVAIIAW
jgi:hypothetical protein